MTTIVPATLAHDMHRFTVERVEQETVTLKRDGRLYQVPLSLFIDGIQQGQEAILSGSLAPKDQRLPDPLARDVLNDLLTPNS